MSTISLTNGWKFDVHHVARGFRYGSYGDRTGSLGFTAKWEEAEDFFEIQAKTEVLATERDDDSPALNREGYLKLADRLEVLAREVRALVESGAHPDLIE